jgi:peroxiredoxin
MGNKMSKLWLPVFLLILTSFPAFAVEVGQKAPDFQAHDIQGAPQSVAQYQGKIVVLEWTNPECPFVKKHYGSDNMQSLQRYAQGRGIVWISVNSSAPGKEGAVDAQGAQAFIKRMGAVPTAYILDPEGRIGHLYGAKTTPHLFVIDEKGTLVYAGAIDDIASPDPADIPKAHNYVREAIDALKSHKPVAVAQTRAYGCSVKY